MVLPMSLLPFGVLAPYRARHFVPGQITWTTTADLLPLFENLGASLGRVTDLPALEQWLLHWGELCAVIDEEGSRRYIAMTCHTDDAEAEKSYLHFVEALEPTLKEEQFKLENALVRHPLFAALPADRYQMLCRQVRVHVELFRPENIPLETEEARLGQNYQKLSGSLTVNFQGEEKTLTQMVRYQEEPKRELRQETWELVTRRRMQEQEKYEDIFDQLINLRGQIAGNAGFANYRDHAFQAKCRFDYTSADCVAFHQAVETEVMPLVKELHAARRRKLQLPVLRPWDLSVDPAGQTPLHPFDNVEDMVAKTQAIFDRLDPKLAHGFSTMRELRLLDLDNRKGKAPGGYQSTLAEARLPFIFMNAVGVQRDVETILHEAGHAFHALATRAEDLYAYRSAPIEFCEVASMSMELLGNEHLDQFYSPADANRARRDHLEGIIKILPWIATIDAFQHWIYTHPGHSRAERVTAWLDLMDRFGGEVDWSGWEDARARLWHRQLHVFLYPFYYIEYGIAQLGALQVWANSHQDRCAALESYQRSLALGGSRPLPELFAVAGCRFDFSARTIRPLMELVRRQLAALPST
jgi:oligoendopeptidase F